MQAEANFHCAFSVDWVIARTTFDGVTPCGKMVATLKGQFYGKSLEPVRITEHDEKQTL
jgi:hypothetical protein